MQEKKSNLLVIILAFLAIFLILSLFLIKNFWQKNQDKKEVKTENVQEKNTQEKLKITPKFQSISPEEVEKNINKDDFVFIDLRPDFLFEDQHIENSINLDPEKLENLKELGKNKKIILIDTGKESSWVEKINELSDQGLQIFYLEGGFENYQAMGFSTISFGYPDSPYDQAKTRPIDAQKLKERLQNEETFVFLDVREKNSFENFHISGSTNIPLEDLEKKKKDIPFGRIIIVDENPIRAFQGAVRLFDMHFIDVLYLSENLSVLKQ